MVPSDYLGQRSPLVANFSLGIAKIQLLREVNKENASLEQEPKESLRVLQLSIPDSGKPCFQLQRAARFLIVPNSRNFVLSPNTFAELAWKSIDGSLEASLQALRIFRSHFLFLNILLKEVLLSRRSLFGTLDHVISNLVKIILKKRRNSSKRTFLLRILLNLFFVRGVD